MRIAIIEAQWGLAELLNFVRDEGAGGSNPFIPILLRSWRKVIFDESLLIAFGIIKAATCGLSLCLHPLMRLQRQLELGGFGNLALVLGWSATLTITILMSLSAIAMRS
ncbi:hypothetical protein PN498_15870 [Oscillatoria sp. CS-180]|uniref:hypothetical protein n=1 Tax=Oscillatoria sp. CS-180 TaxID=3021720 RepID=UPI00232AE511|nr:hypothetical protein [Oscillatoria sp. CS-180]MDB9527476.1 hypothetical protein [Oscillatoria sp. CS-180]